MVGAARRAARRAAVLRHRRIDPRPRLVGDRRTEFRRLALEAGVRRRFAPHQLRHAHAVELAREGVPVNIIQRQLGHTDLGTTSTYVQGIDPTEIINAVRSRRQPMIPASTGLDR
jgi:integrase